MFAWYKKRSSIRALLQLAFAVAGAFIALVVVLAGLRWDLMRRQAQSLYEVDQPAAAVLRVRSDFVSFQQILRHLYDAQDPVQFEKESVALQKAFDGDVDRANRALEMLPPGTWRDAEFSSLEAVRTQFATQLQSFTA